MECIETFLFKKKTSFNTDQPMLFEYSQLSWYLNGTGITAMHLSTKCTFTKGFVCYVSILTNETIKVMLWHLQHL